MRSFVRVLAVAILPLIAACGSSSNTTSPSTSSGTFTVTDVTVGTGTAAAAGRVLSVSYTLWLYDTTRTDGKGTQIQSSVGGAPFSFTLGAGTVIKGWDQGLVGMKVGGLRRLIVPPDLAYGSNPPSGIPSNATLVFDVSLLSVQ